MSSSPIEEVSGPPGQPVCLALTPDPVMAFLHTPDQPGTSSTAVLFCPPFGWEEMCSFRARRRWAQALAKAGFPAARIDLPGTGDSGGSPRDPERLETWTSAVGGAAQWLREASGAERVVVIGIGMGGLVACRAIAQGAPIDDLILWAVAARGRTILRELRAYAGVVAERYPADLQGKALPEGALEVTGFFISPETAAAIELVDLTQLELPQPERRRVMLIGRDALGVDRRLREYFQLAGVELTVVDADDYRELMAHPQEAMKPVASIRRSIEWLKAGEAPATAHRTPVHSPVASARMELNHDGVPIIETPISFKIGPGLSHAMLSEPAAGEREPICAVLLNAGALRRIGPNRTWVELARGWAARGVPTVRIDFEAIGDSDGDERRHITNTGLYAPGMTREALDLLNNLADLGLPDRFVLVGLCSGAYWALHTALADRRVAGAFLVNLYSFYWSEALVAERDRRETAAALRDGVIKRVMRQGVSADQLRRALRGISGGLRGGMRASAEAAQTGEVTLALDRLREQHTDTLLFLSEGEPLYDQIERGGWLARIDEWPNVNIVRLPSTDHMARAIWLQARLREQLDLGLERVLESARARGPAL